ncbi:MAG: type II toxin-antitoxin system RatA family toxin [Labedaea sp.]
MRTVSLLAGWATEDVHRDFQRVTDFGQFPALAPDVRKVAVHPPPTPELARDSDWEVSFRRGLLRWNEWESVDPDRLRVEFDQTEGDFESFHGFWQLAAVPGGAEVRFEASYDFGIDSLAGILDPLAERVVKRIVCAVLSALFGDIRVIEGGEALTDLAESIARQG